MPTEAEFLATMMDSARQYTLRYFDGLKDQDLHREFTVDGRTLNTAYWLIAHLTVSENGLLLISTGGEVIKYSWAKYYTRGGQGLPAHERPPFTEVWEAFNTVHTKAIAHLQTLDEAELDRPNPTRLPVGPQVRHVVRQAIRHESYHTGQLGWLCKLYGIDMG